jgi:hypothetical protein
MGVILGLDFLDNIYNCFSGCLWDTYEKLPSWIYVNQYIEGNERVVVVVRPLVDMLSIMSM